MLSNQQIQNNWPRIKTQVLSRWNKLSEADIEKTHGNSNALSHLISSKYGHVSDFDKTYEKICQSCIPSSKATMKATSPTKNDIENRSHTAPSGEAGLTASTTEQTTLTIDDTFHSGSPERRANANFAHIENGEGHSEQGQRDYRLDQQSDNQREFADELSAYSPDSPSRTNLDDDESEEYTKLYNEEKNMQFTAPDEFYPSQDPSPTREDITLGRNTSSATKISTAKAAPNSSEVSSNDAQKKT